MLKYKPGDDVGPLEAWPFDNPASQYDIRSGRPQASGRLEAGGPGFSTRMGIWRCTVGALACIEQGDELFTVLSGRGVLINHETGTQQDLAPGDTLFVRDGSYVTWDIHEDLTKVFFGHKSGGF